jgi:2-dehydropantoate 2-reductase
MKVAIMGAGGIGAYIGARLAATGAEVAFVARGAHLAALRRDGLRIESPRGNLHLRTVQATDDPKEIGPVDVALLAVKLYDMDTAARRMLPLVGTNTMVVPVQNGVTAPQLVAEIVGRKAVIGGLVYMACHIREPGVVVHLSDIEQFVFGELDGSRSRRIEALREAAAAAGLTARVTNDIAHELWNKFVLLGGHSSVACLSRKPIGDIRSDPDLRSLLVDSMKEVVAVGSAKGIAFDADIIERTLVLFDRFDPRSKASMLGDLETGKPLEVEWLSGALVRLGSELGVPTPVHRVTYACLKPHAGGRKSGS